jgi:MoxR-like ATPase
MIKTIQITREKDIENYLPSPALEDTMKMALALMRPLLLAGKPGTGKTDFGHWYVANANKLKTAEKKDAEFNNVFQFNTKSTSVYNDLFYIYDAVSHFRDKAGDKDISEFITLTALGKAMVCAKGLKNIKDTRLKKIAAHSQLDLKDAKPKSLVIIDEIDKAPRDFPNDLLHEIEHLSFCIKETSPVIEVELNDDEKKNIIILLTSNDEKNLPDAFLRRCLFHYIEFPKAIPLKKIILSKLWGRKLTDEENALIDNGEELKGFEGLNDKIEIFYKIFHNNSIEKKAYTAECIQWINYLHGNKLLHLPLLEYQVTLSALLKKNEDFQEAIKMLEKMEADKLAAEKQE